MPSWNEPILRRDYERLIAASLPEVRAGTIRLNTEGWQNVVFEIGHEFIFRFPRSTADANRLIAETRLLTKLAPSVPVPIPDPIVVGRVPGRRGWPFMGYRRVLGEPLDWDRVQPPQRRQLARDLAPLLRSLTRFPTRVALRLGVRGGGPARWRVLHEQELRRVRRLAFPEMPPSLRESVLVVFQSYLNDSRNFQWRPCLLHTEIHAGHVLVEHGHVSGVIDWGYAAVGDPARELAAWSAHFGSDQISTLAQGRRTADDVTFLDRVALYRTLVPLYHIVGGIRVGNRAMVRDGLRYLRRAIRLPPDQGWTERTAVNARPEGGPRPARATYRRRARPR